MAEQQQSGCKATVLFAGGGTGGHIYPNVGIAQQLAGLCDVDLHFLVSDRAGDATILDRLPYGWTASPASALPPLRRPWKVLPFLSSFRRAGAQVRDLIGELNIGAVVATGGFVSGPAVVAAARRRVPRILCNLDAVPGQANLRLASVCTKVFTAYASPRLPGAERVGLPLRDVSRSTLGQRDARRKLELDPDLRTLFVTGATHGAESIILAVIALVGDADRAARFGGWQVLHQCGTYDRDRLQAIYDKVGVRARVVAYCDEMGAAWGASDLAISRSGAGSVAEAWANAVPTIFLPNPYHRDQHQRYNAQPMVDTGGARMVTDHIDAPATVRDLAPVLFQLMEEPDARRRMVIELSESCPPDGASRIAEAIAKLLGN